MGFRILPSIFESTRKARRLLAIMCIGFLANHRLCKHPLNHLVHVYQCIFTTYQTETMCKRVRVPSKKKTRGILAIKRISDRLG